MEYGQAISAGVRVELSPACDLWMRGARYGIVKSISGEVAVVKMDHPQVKKLQRIPVEYLISRSN